jgi:hypothetical protein
LCEDLVGLVQFWALGSAYSMHKELDLEVLKFGKMCKNGWYQGVGAFLFFFFCFFGCWFLAPTECKEITRNLPPPAPGQLGEIHKEPEILLGEDPKGHRTFWPKVFPKNKTWRGPQSTPCFLTKGFFSPLPPPPPKKKKKTH